MTYLASDELQGRQTYTEGLGLAAGYIASHLAQWGVKPAGDNGTYLQTVRVQSVRTNSNASVTVNVNGQSRTFKDGEAIGLKPNHYAATAELVRARAAAGKPGNPCPKRCAFIATLVGEWEPAPEKGDFPMPDDYPDFPSHAQIAAYFDDYVDHFGLRERIRFNTAVERVELGPEMACVAGDRDVTGRAVQRVSAFYQVEPRELVVVHDEDGGRVRQDRDSEADDESAEESGWRPRR